VADRLSGSGVSYSFHILAITVRLDKGLMDARQTATAEGGPNWVEYLTGCGLKLGYTSPLKCEPQLWDFAFGGADISMDL
jgi:hypothetical protein